MKVPKLSQIDLNENYPGCALDDVDVLVGGVDGVGLGAHVVLAVRDGPTEERPVAPVQAGTQLRFYGSASLQLLNR